MKLLSKTLKTTFLLLFSLRWAAAQVNISGTINAYAPVTAVSFTTGASSTNCQTVQLTIGAVRGTGTFAAGDRVLIMQMQGAYPNLNNDMNFGAASTSNTVNSGIANAGNFEFSTIASVSGSTIVLGLPLVNIYDVAGKIQIVRVPVYTSNVTVNGLLTGESWDGNSGGVIAFITSGSLTLAANISANGLGFSAGAGISNGDGPNGCTDPDDDEYYYNNTAATRSPKGSGVAIPNNNFARGKGAYTNGGGGGNSARTGGGGGGNGGAGGNGGNGGGDCTQAGIGGYSMSPSNSRLFMGGGGGGGLGNTISGTGTGTGGNGGAGGGIIIIQANGINTSGGARSISANGLAGSNGTTSGTGTNIGSASGGGGGAGGSIYINNTGNWGNSGGTLSLTANGGNGGNGSYSGNGNNNNRCSAGGGGGGGGVIRTNAISGTPPTRTASGGNGGTPADSNCNAGSNGANGSPNLTDLTLNTLPTCTVKVTNIDNLCSGTLGVNIFTAGNFGGVTGTNEVTATGTNWDEPFYPLLKTNTAPWNTYAPGFTYETTTTDPPADGEYIIATGSRNVYGSTWGRFDHRNGNNTPALIGTATPTTSTPNAGFMMIVNASYAPSKFFETTITGLCEETQYELSVYLINLDSNTLRSIYNPTSTVNTYGPGCNLTTDPDCPQKVFSPGRWAGQGTSTANSGNTHYRVLPDVDILIEDAVIANTGTIPNNRQWQQKGVTFTTATGVTSVKLSLRNRAPGGGGNDIGVDDITVRPCGPTASILDLSSECATRVYQAQLVPATVYTTPEYQWQYSTDNGVTWNNITGANSATYTVAPPVSLGDELRYITAETSSNLSNPNCRVISEIKSPECVSFKSTSSSASEGAISPTLPTLVANGNFTSAAIVNFTILGGSTATGGGVDYSFSGTFTIPAGTYSGTEFPLTNLNIINESLVESDETIILQITSVTGVTVTIPSSLNTTTHTIINDDVLPLELMSFAAEKFDHNTARLFWRTASERNTSHFVVERMSSIGLFDSLGVVQAAGESDIVLEYSFLDLLPMPGVNYYRLKMVDYDKTFTYTKLVALEFDNQALMADCSSARLYPNPIHSGQLHVFLPNSTRPISYTISNSLGATIKQGEIKNAGVIDINDLAAGLYLLNYECKGQSLAVKFIIEK